LFQNWVTRTQRRTGGAAVGRNTAPGRRKFSVDLTIMWSLRHRKIPVEYVIYPREPYEFTEREHQRGVMGRNLRGYTRWLE
jgi:hypothetical protein